MEEFMYPSSSGSATYRTLINDNGLLSCDCRGWTMKRVGKPRHCKHTKDVARSKGLNLIERDGQMFVSSKRAAVAQPAPQPARAVVAPVRVAPAVARMMESPTRRTPVTATPPPAVATRNGFVSPMLASKLPDGREMDSFDAVTYVMEEKYDGHRIVTRVKDKDIEAWSRLGNKRTLPDHVSVYMSGLPDGLYDGELIVPGGHSFDVTAGLNSGREVMVLFDMLEVLGTSIMDRMQFDRRRFLEEAFNALGVNSAVMLSAQFRPSRAIVETIWARGGEGAIIKSREGKYRPGWRTADWVKIKAIGAATLTVTGFDSGESGPFSVVQLRDDAGNETRVKNLNNETLRECAANPDKYIGSRLVISFQERTPAGMYRHPMFDHWAGEAE